MYSSVLVHTVQLDCSGNVKRFRGGLVFKAHRLVYHSTLGVRVIMKKKKKIVAQHPVRCSRLGAIVLSTYPRHVHLCRWTRKVDVRLPGKENSNSHGARPVHLFITMIKWIRTSRLSIQTSRL